MNNLWLNIVLNEQPVIQLIHGDRGRIFKNYKALTHFPGSTGHYDWLRTTSRRIVGVRYWPFDDTVHKKAVQSLETACRSIDYTSIDGNMRFVSIFFYNSRTFDESLSNDQDMGENGIYVNEIGRIAICFEVDFRFQQDFQNLNPRANQ